MLQDLAKRGVGFETLDGVTAWQSSSIASKTATALGLKARSVGCWRIRGPFPSCPIGVSSDCSAFRGIFFKFERHAPIVDGLGFVTLP